MILQRRGCAIAALVGAVPVFFATLVGLGWGRPAELELFAAWVAHGTSLRPPAVLLRSVRVAGLGSWQTGTLSDVRVRDGRVVRVAPAGSLTPEGDERVVDGAGRTVTPGLIDARSQIVFRDPLRRALPPAVARDSLRAQVRSGVTAVRDLGSPIGPAARLRVALGARVLGPAAELGGPWLSLEPNADRSVDPHEAALEARVVTSSRDVVRAIEEVSRAGGRWLAVRPPADLAGPAAERLDEIAREAASHGLALAVRAVDERSLRWALSVNARSLEELAGYRGEIAEELLGRIASSGAVVVPLANLVRVREVGSNGEYELDKQTRWLGRATWWGELARLDRQIRSRHDAPAERDAARARMESFRTNVARLVASGVSIALGTGSPAAFAFPERPGDEIAELSNAGLVGSALAEACTVTGLKLVTEAAGTGAVVAGAPANLVVWECDPIQDAHCFQRPRWVVTRGGVVEGRPTQSARPFL